MNRLALFCAATSASLILSGCAAFSDSPAAPSSDKASVAAAFYPLAWLAERVSGGEVSVHNLTKPGSEPHDLTLSPAQTAMVADATVVFYESDMQPAVTDAVNKVATGEKLDVATVVKFRESAPLEHEAEAVAEEHGDHEHGELDPHFWLDPLLMADAGDALAETLSEQLPDQADAFAERAASLRGELEALDADFTDGLAQCERDTVVVGHDAFGYLARYGLHFEPIAGLTPGAEPTPADLAHIAKVIKKYGITTVFAERLVSRRAADSVAADTGATVAVLDPIEGLSRETANEDYLTLQQANLAALRKANGCQ